jgi:hypothetical protein
MATQITWSISNLERETVDGFVYSVHYQVSADDEPYTAGAYGSVGLERPDTLVPFDSLTHGEVVGWVKDSLGEEKVAAIVAALEAQINEKRAPSKASGLPAAFYQ